MTNPFQHICKFGWVGREGRVDGWGVDHAFSHHTESFCNHNQSFSLKIQPGGVNPFRYTFWIKFALPQCQRLLLEAGGRHGSGATGPRQRGSQITHSRQNRSDVWRDGWSGAAGSSSGWGDAANSSSGWGGAASSSSGWGGAVGNQWWSSNPWWW